MTTRWEYLVVLWTWRLEYDPEEDKATSWSEIKIWRPGASDPEVREIDANWFPIWNELGDEGWELVADYILSSMLGKAFGWSKGSHPIARRAIFKRPKL